MIVETKKRSLDLWDFLKKIFQEIKDLNLQTMPQQSSLWNLYLLALNHECIIVWSSQQKWRNVLSTPHRFASISCAQQQIRKIFLLFRSPWAFIKLYYHRHWSNWGGKFKDFQAINLFFHKRKKLSKNKSRRRKNKKKLQTRSEALCSHMILRALKQQKVTILYILSAVREPKIRKIRSHAASINLWPVKRNKVQLCPKYLNYWLRECKRKEIFLN